MGKVAVESIRCQSVKFMSGSSGLGELPNTLGLGSDVMKEFLEEGCCYRKVVKNKSLKKRETKLSLMPLFCSLPLIKPCLPYLLSPSSLSLSPSRTYFLRWWEDNVGSREISMSSSVILGLTHKVRFPT